MSRIVKCAVPERCKECARHFIGIRGAEWADTREEFCGCWTDMDNTNGEHSPWTTAAEATLSCSSFTCSPIPRRFIVEEYNETECVKVTFWNSLNEAKYYAHNSHFARIIDRSTRSIVASYGEIRNDSILTNIERYCN